MPLPANLHYYFPPLADAATKTLNVDVCVYGGTAAGVIAAVQTARLGRSVVLLEPSEHIGGMTSGGLSYTDIGNKAAIGGMSREFYKRLGAKYGVAEEWTFEPHRAEAVLHEMLDEAKVAVYTRQFLKSVKTKRGYIQSLTTEAGITVQASVYIDATYEGDLMARAGVHYTVGARGQQRLQRNAQRNAGSRQASVRESRQPVCGGRRPEQRTVADHRADTACIAGNG